MCKKNHDWADYMIVLYIIIAIFTNSFVRVHSVPEWRKGYVIEGKVVDYDMDPNIFLSTAFATVAWPAYWLAYGFDKLVENPPKISLEYGEEQ